MKPTPERGEEALASIDLGPDLIGRNANPASGYPIVTFSWILLYKTGNAANNATLNKVFAYALSEPAQAMAEKMGYIRLPAKVMERGRDALASIQP